MQIKKILNKWKDMTPAAKASLMLIIAKFFQKGLSMISGPIFTRIMPSSEYGIISTFTSWQSVLFIVATLNMSSGIFNNGMLEYKDDRDSFSFSLLCLANLTTLIVTVFYFIFYQTLNHLLDMPSILVGAMIVYFFVTPAYEYWMARQRFEYKYRAITILIMASSLISVILAIVFVLLVPSNTKATAKVLTTEFVAISIGVFFYIYLAFKSKFRIRLKYIKFGLIYSVPLLPHYLSMYVLSSSDRIMISKLVNTSATAIYNVAHTVAAVLLILWNSIDASYAPWIYQNMDIKNYSVIKRRGNQIVVLFSAFTVITTLCAPEIIAVLAPAEYYEGVYVIPSVAASVLFTAVFSLYMRVELYLKKTKIVMWGTIFTAVLNIVLNYVFISKCGYIAAGYTTLVSYVVLSIIHACNLKRNGYGEVYDSKFIAIVGISVIALSLFLTAIYPYGLIRYGLLLLIIIFVYIKREEINSFRKKK